MDIYQSIRTGLAPGGSFLIRNSGNFFAVAMKVAEAAGRLVPEDATNIQGGGPIIDSFVSNFRAANEIIIQEAEKAADSIRSDLATSSGAKVQKDLLNGVWAMPVPSNESGAALPLYQDIATFLQASDVPTYVEGRDGVDIAALVAKAIFANFISGRGEASATRGGVVQNIPFSLAGLYPGLAISGSHAFYLIPLLSGSGDDFAMHSALSIRTTRSLEFRRAGAGQGQGQQPLTLSAPSPNQPGTTTTAAAATATATTAGGSPLVWVVTLQIEWSTVHLAQGGANAIKQHLDRNFTVMYQQTYGAYGFVKIKASSNSSPGQVRQAVLTVLARSMSAAGGGGGGSGDVQIPTVTVTNASLVMDNGRNM